MMLDLILLIPDLFKKRSEFLFEAVSSEIAPTFEGIARDDLT